MPYKYSTNSTQVQQNTTQIQQKYIRNTLQIQNKYTTNLIQLQYKFNTNSTQIQYKFNKIQYKFNKNTIQTTIHKYNTKRIGGPDGGRCVLMPAWGQSYYIRPLISAANKPRIVMMMMMGTVILYTAAIKPRSAQGYEDDEYKQEADEWVLF